MPPHHRRPVPGTRYAQRGHGPGSRRGLSGLSYLPRSGVDGAYGPRTQNSVGHFQRDNGVAVDGIAGPRTTAAMGVAREIGSTGPGGGSPTVPVPPL
ncbi:MULTISPECIES: peptidoglycan-binding domain-containing protein [unclassified Streptomyces]|uniref:peptidoglycan-binding domain-containing protein n=1 Tax=unclassified Streptomyces TaxID=2593676 RepID=UPI002E2ADDB9|nr:peptidoglycan-binding domain-containing protein [Streptomyces sp. NBC_01439]